MVFVFLSVSKCLELMALNAPPPSVMYMKCDLGGTTQAASSLLKSFALAFKSNHPAKASNGFIVFQY